MLRSIARGGDCYAAKDAGRDRVSIWTPNLRARAVTRASQQIARAR